VRNYVFFKCSILLLSTYGTTTHSLIHCSRSIGNWIGRKWFEIRKIRLSTTRDEELASKNVFVNKRNIKWYILIGIAIVLWAINGAYTRSI